MNTLGAGVAAGPLDPMGASHRHQLGCPYCAPMLDWKGHPPGDRAPYASRYECPSCRAVWTIALDSVRA